MSGVLGRSSPRYQDLMPFRIIASTSQRIKSITQEIISLSGSMDRSESLMYEVTRHRRKRTPAITRSQLQLHYIAQNDSKAILINGIKIQTPKPKIPIYQI
jgi:hypothetical protein